MNLFSKFFLALKATRQLGLRQAGLYARYRLGLLSGHYRRVTAAASQEAAGGLSGILPLPGGEDLNRLLGEEGRRLLMQEAEEITAGRLRLFGGEPVPLRLTFPGQLAHWTAYETGKAPLPGEDGPVEDVKFLWEPARFGWAFTLGRAYHLTAEEKYAAAFWQAFEAFTSANPPYEGPHWMSGQEAALRLMAFVSAGQVFAPASASTPERCSALAASIAAHAARIPPTLVYARAQHNNHLLTEAAGLLTAGLALPDHPHSPRWRGLGWRWLNAGLQAQIDSYGEYAQHSTNYQRLMLQVALWINAILPAFKIRWPRPTLEALRRSVHWYLSLLDSESGLVPNLGANDGACILPLSTCPFADHRPTAHAAGRAFLDYDLPPGPWDEMSLWLGARAEGKRALSLGRYLGDQLYGRRSWAYFRTAQFNSRPSHADQLHLDLWWRGTNVTLDPGTYRYTAAPPWDNALTAAQVHNTVTVNGRDQMRRVGRFLYLDWVQAYRKALPLEDPRELQRVRGRYRRGGFRHTRIVTARQDDLWRVEDEVLDLQALWRRRTFFARLHWLLPDWGWEMENAAAGLAFRLVAPHGALRFHIRCQASGQAVPFEFSLGRLGELLAGVGPVEPVRGWVSPTYGIKVPALSLAVTVRGSQAVAFTTTITFPGQEA